MRQYKRNIRVIIGEDDGEAVEIEGLFIRFEINKEADSKPNEGTIRIYNLNESTETQIRQRGVRVRLLAGYDGDFALVFDGDIRKVEKERHGVDRISVITIGGNVFRLTNAEFIRSYEGAVSLKTIVSDALPSFNLAQGAVDMLPDNVFLHDFAWSGRTYDLLDRVLRPQGIQWYETDGEINFSVNGATQDDLIYVINADTGMIGSPTIADNGLRVQTLLNPRLRITGRVRIESLVIDDAAAQNDVSARAGEYQGIYKITKILHTGDNRAGHYFSEAVVVPVGDNA